MWWSNFFNRRLTWWNKKYFRLSVQRRHLDADLLAERVLKSLSTFGRLCSGDSWRYPIWSWFSTDLFWAWSTCFGWSTWTSNLRLIRDRIFITHGSLKDSSLLPYLRWLTIWGDWAVIILDAETVSTTRIRITTGPIGIKHEEVYLLTTVICHTMTSQLWRVQARR